MSGPKLAQASIVDLALVLAVDCSSSVDLADFRMQMDGIAAAIRNPLLLDAISAGSNRRIALTLVQWSSRRSQVVSVPWRLLADGADLEAMAGEVARVERRFDPGGTGLAAAIGFSTAILQALSFAAERRLIDVSGDGMDNEDGHPGLARDLAVARGITINGLPILYGSSHLEAYYRKFVIGGPRSFLIPAKDLRSFEDAMTRKLLREITQYVS